MSWNRKIPASILIIGSLYLLTIQEPNNIVTELVLILGVITWFIPSHMEDAQIKYYKAKTQYYERFFFKEDNEKN